MALRPDGTPYPYDVRQAQLRQDRGFLGKHGLFKNAVLPAVGFAAAPFAVGALWGGAGAASAATSAAPAAAATGGAGGMTLGNIWNLANLGVQGVSSLFGQRANTRATNQQISLAEREMAMRMAADAEARAEAKRQFDAQQANEARRFAAEDEERVFNRRLLEDREARRAPYRAQADRARQRLAAFLGL